MTYVFTFLGEFGYELFNWQGVIRKWIEENKNRDDKIVICSRKGLDQLYDFADYYLDISSLESYKKTIADCYTGYIFINDTNVEMPRREWQLARSGNHIEEIKNDIKGVVSDKMTTDNIEWIWSCEYRKMNGLHFGLGGPGGGSIYTGRLNLSNNKYAKIEIKDYDKIYKNLKNKLNFDIDIPYILCQTAWRKGYDHKCNKKINHEKIFSKMSNELPIVSLEFNTGRNNDSLSEINSVFINQNCDSFDEQLVLIKNSKYCIFTTEGDFRSHTYIPPLLGKDVYVIASEKVLSFDQTSCEFWNENIFNFGGNMFTLSYEELLKNGNLEELLND